MLPIAQVELSPGDNPIMPGPSWGTSSADGSELSVSGSGSVSGIVSSGTESGSGSELVIVGSVMGVSSSGRDSSVGGSTPDSNCEEGISAA